MVKIRVYNSQTGEEYEPSEFKYITFFDDFGELQGNQTFIKIKYEIVQENEESTIRIEIK